MTAVTAVKRRPPIQQPRTEDQFWADFWAEVEKTDGCWIWGGSRTKQGYGYCTWSALGAGKHLAHRLVFEKLVRRLEAGELVCHTCDNPRCVRPDHLFAGNKSTNAWDMVAKGRARGANSGKTHCKRGHEFTPENTGHTTAGRYCRECNRQQHRRWLESRQAV